MKCYRRLAVVVLTVATAMTLIAGPAIARQPTRQHVSQYQHSYRQVVQKYGHRAPGRNIVRWGLSSGRAASDTEVIRSLAVLHQMLVPRMAATVGRTAVRYGSAVTQSVPANGLVQCILRAEGAGPTTVNSSGHMGIGQWDEPTWLADGGGRYASSPTGASYDEQLRIIEEQVRIGHTGQWTKYEHGQC